MTNLDVLGLCLIIPNLLIAGFTAITFYRTKHMTTAPTKAAILATLTTAKATVDAYTLPASTDTDLTDIAVAADALAASIDAKLSPTTAPAGDTLAFTTTELPAAVANTPYSATVATTGGTGAVSVEATGLPSWLIFAGGVLAGTAPSVAETDSITFTATDSATPPVVVSMTLTLTVA